jgi:hypothetical protein
MRQKLNAGECRGDQALGNTWQIGTGAQVGSLCVGLNRKQYISCATIIRLNFQR